MAKRKTKRETPAPAKAPDARAVEAALAGIVHDIRTPLTGIVALAELLATSDLGAREREWANAIKSGADHLAALTTLIVDAVKADATGLVLQHEPFSPRRLAEAVAAALAARAGNKGIKTEIAIGVRPAGDGGRRRAAAARGAGKPRRQCGQIHRRRHRRLHRRRQTGRRQARAAHLHRRRQRHRHRRAGVEKSVPAVRAGERGDRAPLRRRRPRPAASSSASPRPWAAALPSTSKQGKGTEFVLSVPADRVDAPPAGRARRRARRARCARSRSCAPRTIRMDAW